MERRDRLFRRGIAAATLAVLVGIVAGSTTGRYLARRAVAGSRRAARVALGFPASRDEIEAEWALKRARGIAQATATYRRVFDEAPPAVRRLMRSVGLAPGDALLRTGNFDKVLVLPSSVFLADDAGRSYRLRPNLRAVWLRGVDLTHGLNGFFLVPDDPGLPALLDGTGASIVPGSVQTTNSWGLRGPEPDPGAPLRGIVLGDSYMQGYFIGDADTPPARLGRDLERRLGASVSLLNTGVLGYSPEQYFHALAEFGDRFRPQFVVLSPFANDFGDIDDAIRGLGDWEEGRYWLDRIDDYCRARGILRVTAPVPYDHQITSRRGDGSYPGRVSDLSRSSSLNYCFPIEDLVDEFLRIRGEAERTGAAVSANPLYNLDLGDRHFSPRGAEVWARALGRRLALLLGSMRRRGLVSF